MCQFWIEFFCFELIAEYYKFLQNISCQWNNDSFANSRSMGSISSSFKRTVTKTRLDKVSSATICFQVNQVIMGHQSPVKDSHNRLLNKDGPPKPFKTIQASKVQLRNTNVSLSLKKIKTMDNITPRKSSQSFLFVSRYIISSNTNLKRCQCFQ